jgi:hypothetical protein
VRLSANNPIEHEFTHFLFYMYCPYSHYHTHRKVLLSDVVPLGHVPTHMFVESSAYRGVQLFMHLFADVFP